MRSRSARGRSLGRAVATAVATAAIATGVTVLQPEPRQSEAATDVPALPLGPGTLAETRTTRQLAPGVTHVAIERGEASPDDVWTVTAGLGTTEAEVAELERRVRAAGHEPRRDATAGPDPAGPADRPLGWLVRVGRYADRAEADAVRAELAAQGVSGTVEHTVEDGHPTTGPWSLDVLVIEPGRFTGRLRSELADGIVPGRETVSSIARRAGALAAVNGGFFVTGGTRTTPGNWVAGTEGDPSGVSVVGGDLVSEAVNDRPALVLPSESGRRAAVRRIHTVVTVRTASGATRTVTGLNRQAGLVVNCGGVGNLTPVSHPAHDYTCGNPDELVAVTPRFGGTAPEGPGYQATLDAGGRVTAVRAGRGGAVPAGGTVLQGTGTEAEWLRAHARVGAQLTLRRMVLDKENGRQVGLSAQTSLINGGPLLLRDGRVALDPLRDGFGAQDIGGSDRAVFHNSWYLQRAPRTAAGITAQGRIVLLTVDGRRPGYSAGLTIAETAAVMRSLGAVNALNLDGGGSTTMVVQDELQGIPSDRTGERPDGDALLILPPATG
ncbi:phosphodiester glycosidase family protein [Streptomyces sp. enrichment culture]|uniref:phosphodiester glycosidase family protein n=1 Tax=Streptomyces sp. enrichment culture TaxID=1795815 RepID=UPI003F54FB06